MSACSGQPTQLSDAVCKAGCGSLSRAQPVFYLEGKSVLRDLHFAELEVPFTAQNTSYIFFKQLQFVDDSLMFLINPSTGFFFSIQSLNQMHLNLCLKDNIQCL